jgi:hypothetical protein
MVHVVTQNLIDDMLKHPHRYITSERDEVILNVYTETSNPTMLMLGYDTVKESYYFVVEDDEVSEDIYCEKENLTEMFNTIMDKLLKGEV